LTANPTVPVSVALGTAGTLPTAPCYGDLVVTQVNSNLIGLLQSRDTYIQELVKLEVARILEKRANNRRSGDWSKDPLDD